VTQRGEKLTIEFKLRWIPARQFLYWGLSLLDRSRRKAKRECTKV